jgi:hypothetical protein
MPRQSKIREASDFVNSRIDAFANEAFSSAYRQALSADRGVLAVVDGTLYRVYADGRREKIKDVAKRIKRISSKTYTLKA